MTNEKLSILMHFTELVLKNKNIQRRIEMSSYQNVFLKNDSVLTFWSENRSVFTTSICHIDCADYISEKVWIYATTEFVTLLEFTNIEELVFQYSLIVDEPYIHCLVLLSFFMKLCKENDCVAISSNVFSDFDFNEAERILKEHNVQY